MADFTPGDVVVLKSGSMRMLVETIDGDSVGVVWANEGAIGRDTLPAFALNKWEDRPPRPRDDERGGGKPWGGDRKGGGKPYGGGKEGGGDRPYKPKTGMDGKPRQKTHFRKDD